MEYKFDGITVRLISKTDGEAFYQLIQNNRSRLEDFFAGTVAKTQNLEDTIAYCSKIENLITEKRYFPFLLIDKDGNTIGLIDFKNLDWNVPKVEVGAFIDSNFEGIGIISKIGTQLLELMVKEHQFKKVYCRAAAQNKRSIRVILRLGFELEGVLRRDYKTTKGELVDLNFYGKLYD